MAKHEVVAQFRDLLDKAKSFPEGRVYEAGDLFPATKRKVADERIEEIKAAGFIVEIEDDEKPKEKVAKEDEKPKEEK